MGQGLCLCFAKTPFAFRFKQLESGVACPYRQLHPGLEPSRNGEAGDDSVIGVARRDI